LPTPLTTSGLGGRPGRPAMSRLLLRSGPGQPPWLAPGRASRRYGRPVTLTEERQAWCGRFDALHDSILDLFHSRRVWRTIRAMIETNLELQRSGIVEHWLARCYTASQMTAIRRQLDRDRRAASLWRSLHLLAKRPALMTRSWFTAQMEARGTDPQYFASVAARFDRFADPGVDSVSTRLVIEDMERLVIAGDTARTIVNKVLAHHEYRPGAASPEITWVEFDNAIDVVGGLYKKYYELRHPGSVLGNLTPDLPPGWDRMFDTAWKPPGFVLPNV
jgi:hypothetical protein